METTLKDKKQMVLATWTETEPAPLNQRGRPYIIPRYYVDPDNGLTDLKEYPKRIIGDTDLSTILQTTKQTLHRWRKRGIIPFKKGPGIRAACAYDLREVVEALENHGYFRDEE